MTNRNSTASKHALHEEVTAIRQALLIGLLCYGEIERLQDVVLQRKLGGKEELTPIDPTGRNDTTSEFANALLYLESVDAVCQRLSKAIHSDRYEPAMP
jgi:hypothetical protein